jgi:hypothetical protein
MSAVSGFIATIKTIALSCVLGLSPVAAGERPTGVWQGHYMCPQGETLLRLTILAGNKPDSPRRALFYFTPRPDADDRSSGCFSMQESLLLPEIIYFRQDSWIRQPPDYVMVDLSGRMDAEGGYSGRVVWPGCDGFSLRKVLDEPNEATACEPLSQ